MFGEPEIGQSTAPPAIIMPWIIGLKARDSMNALSFVVALTAPPPWHIAMHSGGSPIPPVQNFSSAMASTCSPDAAPDGTGENPTILPYRTTTVRRLSASIGAQPDSPGPWSVRLRRLCESDSFGRVNLRKPAVALAPICGGWGKPAGELHDVRVVFDEMPPKYRFVMGDTVPERPDLCQRPGEVLAAETLAILSACDVMEDLLPENLVARRQHRGPKAEGQGRHDPSGSRVLPVVGEIFARLDKLTALIVDKQETVVVEPTFM